jgi:dTDP-4-amino-4,6-dideoxygalactose transaminase
VKESIHDLAIFGGKPGFKDNLHVGRPNIGNRERFIQRINDLLDRRWLSNSGPFVQEFEREICRILNVKHCIAVCNGTLALQIAIRATELKGEVIVPSFTFIATAHALEWQGINPIFCDIDQESYNIDPNQVEEKITPRTTGIIGVHLWGRPCDIEPLAKIAKRHNLRLLFDAAHAFGCSYKGRMIGKFGDAEILSFHATKFINSFEGGAVVTNNDDLADKSRVMRNFGFAGFDNVISPGINGKMNEASAAMGLTSLESLEEFISINHRNYKRYQKEIANVPGLKILEYNESEKCNYQHIVFEMDENNTHISRDQMIEILHKENVLARRYFYPGCHRMEPYQSSLSFNESDLTETDKLAKRVISLPTGEAVSTDDISKICQIIRFVVANGKRIKDRLVKENIKLLS